MSNHTKGPWTLGKKEYGYVDVDALQGRVPHRGLARVVWCLEGAQCSPSMEANARLIASAPELLECLKDARRLLTDQDAIDLVHIDEVIAKAEGAVA